MAATPFSPTFAAKDFPFEGKVVEVTATDTVHAAFATLIAHNLLSVPVWNPPTNNYLGFFDLSDAVRFSTSFDHVKIDARPVGEMIKELSSHEFFAPWIPRSMDTPWNEIMSILKTKAKRVPILGVDGKIVKIISQSAVAKYIADWLSRTPPPHPKSFSQTARESGLAMKTVVTLSEDATAKEAFDLLLAKNLSAIGIMDDEGHLLTCMTAKDIRLVPQLETQGEMTVEALLSLGVVDFVSKARIHFEKLGKARPAIVVVHDDTPVEVICHKLSKTHMHRVFIVDKSGNPSGVFTVGDVCRLL